jgi:hypothetical protein
MHTGSQYVPGVCNIGPAEIRRRRLAGWAGLGAAVLLLVALGGLYIHLFPTRAGEPVPAVSPTPDVSAWLIATPFVPAPDWIPPVITTDLPKGFHAEADASVWESPHALPGSHLMRILSVRYARSDANGTPQPDEVDVQIYGFSDAAGRTLGIHQLLEGEQSDRPPAWRFSELGGERVAGLTSSHYESYVWIAGPYVLLTAGRLDPNVGGGNPWAVPIAERYLELYPPRADFAFPSPTPDPSAWLTGAPLLPVPEGTPAVISDGLPEGFGVAEIQPIEEANLAGYSRGVLVKYVRREANPEGSAPFDVYVLIVGYSDKTTRDNQATQIHDRGMQCDFVLVGGKRVVGCYGLPVVYRIWISGPYLVSICDTYSRIEGGNPWLDQFAEKYLALYPSS